MNLLKVHDIVDLEVVSALKTLVDKKIIEFDAESKAIIINMDVMFKIKGNLQIDCDKHVILNSGKVEDEKINEPYSIWLNPVMDSKGNLVVDDANYIEQSDTEWPLIH
jgi:hypothetical protein